MAKQGGVETKTNLILKQIAQGISGLSSPTVSLLKYQTANIDKKTTFADSFLFGKVESTGNGFWYIQRFQLVGNDYVSSYAVFSNNSGQADYASAWSNRATLNYTDIESVIIP